MTSVAVLGVDVDFGSTRVLRHAELRVSAGEIVAVLGPSGSGKSTLLRVIAGIVQPDAGTVEIGGVDMTSVPTHQRGVGMVFQGDQLFTHRSVADNVAFGLKMQGVDRTTRMQRADDWLDRVGLEGFGRRRVADLSGGEARRVALARTLAAEPRAVLLDEPLTGLDRDLHDRLATDLATLLRDDATTAILVTHDRAEADMIATRSMEMEEINESP